MKPCHECAKINFVNFASGIKRSYQESRCYQAKDVPISENTKKESCRLAAKGIASVKDVCDY